MRTRREIQMVTTEGEVEQPYSPSNPPPGISGREILASGSVQIIDGQAKHIPLSRNSERVIFILVVSGVTSGDCDLYLQYMLDGSSQGEEAGLREHYFDIPTSDGNVLTIYIQLDSSGESGEVVFETFNFGVPDISYIVYSD